MDVVFNSFENFAESGRCSPDSRWFPTSIWRRWKRFCHWQISTEPLLASPCDRSVPGTVPAHTSWIGRAFDSNFPNEWEIVGPQLRPDSVFWTPWIGSERMDSVLLTPPSWTVKWHAALTEYPSFWMIRANFLVPKFAYSSFLAPVQTSLPDLKISAVHLGSLIRITTPWKRDGLYSEFRVRKFMFCRFNSQPRFTVDTQFLRETMNESGRFS